ncbi:MAG: insulinase family protein [Fibrobacter sp.]|nr:insulinase family protein [Fibrobacter sp.]
MKSFRSLIKSGFIILSGMIIGTSFAKEVQSVIPLHPSKLKYDSLNWTVPLGQPFRDSLKNGMVLYLAEDQKLPLVRMTGYIRSGDLADPAGKEGLYYLLTTLMRSGGTLKFPSDTLNELIDLFAMKFNFSAGNDNITFSGSFLTEYTDQALDIFEQMLFHPAFEEKKLRKEKNIAAERIKHRFDNPGPTLKAAYKKQMYQGQVNSKFETITSINNVTREDLIAVHKKIVSPGNIILSIAGKFASDTMRSKINNIFSKDSLTFNKVILPDVKINADTQNIIIQKPVSQAYVRLGLPLFKRPNPDYYAISLLNEILGGGGFTSRLGAKIRSDAGLTYSIYSVAESNYTYPGTFYIDFFTKNESFAEAVALTLEEVRRIVKEGVTKEELANAKSSLLGDLPSMFRSPFDIVSTYAWNEFYGRDQLHYRNYAAALNKITAEDILRVANTYLTADKFTYTVVGDTTKLLNQESHGFSLKNYRYRVLPADSIVTLP